ncbi:MAG TPA: 5-oxoprolinase subunit PxpB [Flavisolibacter sp.]|nr:5-oxoprolinase subunit PxpB [Flavisolibacter sp.]
MAQYRPYSLFPLGDTALLIDFGNTINEEINDDVLRLFHFLKDQQHPFIKDLVPAYSSLAIYYDVMDVLHHMENGLTAFDVMAEVLDKLITNAVDIEKVPGRTIKVPVCYADKFATDIHYLAKQNGLDVEEVIQLHTSGTYKVFMLGFTPGFAYMGVVDDKLAIKRKPVPKPVVAGSVGIAGIQTGIYSLDSPGGWQIIGRTPLRLFDPGKENPVLFEPGNHIKFYSITEDEFENS